MAVNNQQPTESVRSAVSVALSLLPIILGVAMATLSLTSLISEEMQLSLSAALESLLDRYESLSQWALGWLEPYGQAIVRTIEGVLSVDLQLSPLWKHVFILMFLYYGRDIKNFISVGDYAGAALITPLALGVCLISSVTAGLIQATTSDFLGQLAIAAAPVLGYFVYFLFRSMWAAYKFTEADNAIVDYFQRVMSVARDTVVGLAFVTLGLHFPFIQDLSNPGVGVLLTLVPVFAAWQIRKGWVRTTPSDANSVRQERLERFMRHGNTKLGREILGSLALSILLIVVGSAR